MLTFQNLDLGEINLVLEKKGLFYQKGCALKSGELITLGKSISPLGEVLSWDFGQVMEMNYREDSENYLFSNEKVPLHWDGAFHREPQYLIFFCKEVSTSHGGETLFVNTEKVYDALSDDDKKECAHITLKYETQKLAHYGGKITIDLLGEHPLWKRPILRIAEEVITQKNPVKREQLSGSDELCRHIESLLYKDEFCYTHRWQAGDLVIVDNFTFIHGRNGLGDNLQRSFNRVQAL